ncbi:NUDIX hydrolase [Streptococcus catagoni]|uniref:NUDIX hydrolase n=1 Tax=Streptococcus catagoni TaxID=2654874 RepID=UPI001409E36D|nr:CoA pyrophosphatase [Streptococcus catagoni]
MSKAYDEIIKTYQPKPLGEEKRYAVFLPLIWDKDQWQILYEIRSQHISQPGEVSFPGGKVEKGETYCQAAIRETVEELNIRKEEILVWGEIDYIIQGKRSIHCFVGELKISDWQSIRPNEEVDRLFTVPLEKMLDSYPVYYELASRIKEDSNFPFDRIKNGVNYSFSNRGSSIPFYENLDQTIWGMTAQFTACFTDIIKGAKKK